jgi:AraC-like DNA-binding protein
MSIVAETVEKYRCGDNKIAVENLQQSSENGCREGIENRAARVCYNISMENDEKFNLLISYTEKIFQLKFTLASSDETVETFSRENFVHPLQTWLTPQALQLILAQADRSCLNWFTDALNLQVAFFYYQGMPVLAGPFLTQKASQGYCTALAHRYPDLGISVEELLIYFGKYPVIPQKDIEHLLSVLCEELGLGNPEYHVVSYTGTGSEMQENPGFAQVSNGTLEEHYHEESLFMDAIERGNTQEALRYLRKTIADAHGLQNNTSLPVYRQGAALSRGMARSAAYRAGLPASLIHRITSRSARLVDSAEIADDILKEQENVVQQLCMAVARMRSGKYSALVQTVLYTLDTMYGQDISEHSLADEIGVTESYMIAVFRRETGQTPGQYLRDARIKNAARMLSSSGESIQAVAEKCGIPDSNYFVKLFRARYGCTPREYRKKYCV